MVDMGISSNIMKSPSPKCYMTFWDMTIYTTPSIDQTLHQFANLLPNWTLIPILTLLPNFGGFHRTLQRVRLANRGRLLLRTPGPVPFGTCICSNVETILSWTCHVYGPFEFRTSLGTSILLSRCFTYFLKSYGSYFPAVEIFATKTIAKTRKLLPRENFHVYREKKKEIWPSPMTKPPIPTENSKIKGQHTNATKNFDYTTIADRLRTVSWGNKSSNWCG